MQLFRNYERHCAKRMLPAEMPRNLQQTCPADGFALPDPYVS